MLRRIFSSFLVQTAAASWEAGFLVAFCLAVLSAGFYYFAKIFRLTITPPDSVENMRRSELVERGRYCKDLDQLRCLGPYYMAKFWRKPELAVAFPVYGVLMGLADRGVYDGGGLKRWMRRWANRRYCRLLGRRLGKFPLDPGWNDFYMIRWLMTGDRMFLADLYGRASQKPAPGDQAAAMVRQSARWILYSMRNRQIDLDCDLAILERASGDVITEDRQLAALAHLERGGKLGNTPMQPGQRIQPGSTTSGPSPARPGALGGPQMG